MTGWMKVPIKAPKMKCAVILAKEVLRFLVVKNNEFDIWNDRSASFKIFGRFNVGADSDLAAD